MNYNELTVFVYIHLTIVVFAGLSGLANDSRGVGGTSTWHRSNRTVSDKSYPTDNTALFQVSVKLMLELSFELV